MDKKQRKNIEYEGNSVEDAIENAIEDLGVSREDLVVRVVCEEKKGLFGMEGAKQAKIKVTIKEKDNNA